MVWTIRDIEAFLQEWNKASHPQGTYQGYCWSCKKPSESNYPDNICPYCNWATMEWS